MPTILTILFVFYFLIEIIHNPKEIREGYKLVFEILFIIVVPLSLFWILGGANMECKKFGNGYYYHIFSGFSTCIDSNGNMKTLIK